MKLIAFQPAHVIAMRLQERQRNEISCLEYLTELQHAGLALTALQDGETIACGGIARTALHGTLWGFIARDSKRHFVVLDRIVRRMLSCCDLQRVEATVDSSFANGCRWLELLEFKLETPEPMRNYGPHGEDHYLYARVR